MKAIAAAVCGLLGVACSAAAPEASSSLPVATASTEVRPAASLDTARVEAGPTSKVTEQAPPAPSMPREPFQIKLTSPKIEFDFNSDVLRPESDAALKEAADYLQNHPEVTLLRVDYHTDSKGSASYALVLSNQRALAIARRLVELGVDCRRLLAIGWGMSRPIVSNDTAAGRQLSRRAELWVVQWRGNLLGEGDPLGGNPAAGDPCTK